MDSEKHTEMMREPVLHTHADGHLHPGHHIHSEEHKRRIVNRISRAVGHLEAVKRMVEQDVDCSEVLIQLTAVRAEINGTGREVLKSHLAHCIVEAIEQGDRETIDQLNRAIDMFVK